MKKLGILGLGHMGMAVAEGALRLYSPEDVCAYDISPQKQQAAQKLGITIFPSCREVCENASIVLTAIRPQDIDQVLQEIREAVPQCILTIAAGIPIRRFTDVLGSIPVIRAMPNTPLQLGEGAVALCRNEVCPDAYMEEAMKLFSTMGKAVVIDESHMCDIIAVNGSTPAYFYYLVQCLLEDAVSRGIDEADARTLIVQTMIGSGKLLEADPQKPVSEFVIAVCSKGGTTIEAISVMKKRDLNKLIRDADQACIDRAEELGR